MRTSALNPGRIHSFLLMSCFVLAFVASPANGQVGNALEQAKAWLTGTQNPNGSFGALGALTPRDSALAVLALAGTASDLAVTQAAVYLEGVPEANTEFRSQRALALAVTGRPFQPLLDSIFDFRNGGGMGPFTGHQSTLLDTGLAVEALTLEETARLLDIVALTVFLQLHQNSDGGWGFAPDKPSEVYYTAEILRALAGLGQLSIGAAVKDAGAAFLLSRQQADGGFGSVIETALAYRALLDLGCGSPEGNCSPTGLPFGSPVPYLLTRQKTDGSWEGDAFTTSQVILALRKQRPNLVAVLDAPRSVAPDRPIRVTVTVTNAGPEPAPASQVEIRFDAGGELAATAPVEALAPGAEADIVLDLDAGGREGSIELFAVVDAGGEVAEADEDDNVVSASVTLRAGPDLGLYRPGSDPQGATRDEALRLKNELDAYNNLQCDADRGNGSGGTGNGNGNGNGGSKVDSLAKEKQQ